MSNLIAAQRHVQALLLQNEYKEKRHQSGIKNVSTACEYLLKNKKKLTHKLVGDYIVAKFEAPSNKPSYRTIDNDPKGIYQPIIKKYRECIEKVQDEKISESNLAMGHKELLIYTKQLEKKFKQLKIQMKILEDNFLSTNVFDLATTLSQPVNDVGGVDPVKSSELTKEQKMALGRLLDADEVKFEEYGGKMCAVDDSGEVILHASEYKLLADLIK
jgi:hypothetical protein